MTHPVIAHSRCFGAAAVVALVTATGVSAQESVNEGGDEMIASSEFNVPEIDMGEMPQSLEPVNLGSPAPEFEDTILTTYDSLNYQGILSNASAVEFYRQSYRDAQNAAQKIYETETAFNALYDLTPEEIAAQFPDGGYDDALNAANDAYYYALEDGLAAGDSLREARYRLAGGPVTDEQAAELDRLLGL